MSESDLEKKGQREYTWAKSNMRITTQIINKYKNLDSLNGITVGICLHITKETAVLVIGLKQLGADVYLCSANPLSTQESIVSFLTGKKITVYGKRGESLQEFNNNIYKILNHDPDIIIDDGGELHKKALEKKNEILGGTEETTSGVNRLKTWNRNNFIKYPIIAVNQSRTKHLFDNRYGTGQSTIEGILRTTGILLVGKRIVVCGYGWVGKGISSFLKGVGSKVTITEIDAIHALEAFMDGFEVKTLEETTPFADLFITCTGQINVIRQEHIEKMKNGVILCNAGHFDVEIETSYLIKMDKNPIYINENMKSYNINEKKIYLLSEGRVINLVGAEGNSPEIMALSFANQLLSVIYLAKHHKELENKIYNVPKKIEKEISRLALQKYGIKIDKKTFEQSKYYYS
ncbi:MAG TPA: adenosylhomocysteinase [Candidatus Nitrosocosmicus sp.]